MKNIITKFLISYTILAQLLTPLFAAELDLTSPIIDHQMPSHSIDEGTPIQIQAIVDDNEGVKSVTLFCRTDDKSSYQTIEMSLTSGNNQFSATIPGADVSGKNLQYYIQAIDVNGNTVTRGGKNFPLHIALQSTAIPDTTALDNNIVKDDFNWWIVFGIAVGAALIGGASSGGDDSGTAAVTDKPTVKTGTIIFTGPQP